MVDTPIRGRGRGRPRRQQAATPRRGSARTVRRVREDTPPVVVEEVADSEDQSVVQPRGPPIEFEPWFPGQADMRQIFQHEVIPVE